MVTIATLIGGCVEEMKTARQFLEFYSNYRILLGCLEETHPNIMAGDNEWNLVTKNHCIDPFLLNPTTDDKTMVHNSTYMIYLELSRQVDTKYYMVLMPKRRLNSSYVDRLVSLLENRDLVAAISISESTKPIPTKISMKSNVLWIESSLDKNVTTSCYKTELLDHSFIVKHKFLRTSEQQKALKSTPRQTLGLSYYFKQQHLDIWACGTGENFNETDSHWPRCLYDYLDFQIDHSLIDVIDSRSDPYNRSYTPEIEYCNMTRALLYRKQYGNVELSSSNEESIIARNPLRLLKLASETLKTINRQFLLHAGTLLGWYRQCGFINYSGDVDSCMPIEDYSPSIVPLMNQAGFKVLRFYGEPPSSQPQIDGLEYTFEHIESGLRFDIFFCYRDSDGKIWFGTWYGNNRKIARLYFEGDYLDLKTVDFAGQHHLVPKDVEKALITQYGPSWNIPVREWNWYRSPKNIYYEPFPRWPEPYNLFNRVFKETD